jgi:hypothetical protein
MPVLSSSKELAVLPICLVAQLPLFGAAAAIRCDRRAAEMIAEQPVKGAVLAHRHTRTIGIVILARRHLRPRQQGQNNQLKDIGIVLLLYLGVLNQAPTKKGVIQDFLGK